MPRPRVVVVLPAYNASSTLERTVGDIPPGAADALLVVDDASVDDTVAVAEKLGIPTLVHSVNRGYGANQKTCYRTALEMGADIVVMLHPDYQYDPRLIPEMVDRIARGDCEVVLGSRMMDGQARQGGMPWWKRLGNVVLTTLQNRLLGSRLSEFHTGYRAFSRRALEVSGFERFEDGFVFDAQMLVAMIYRGVVISEVPCPARYLPDSSSVGLVGSLRYGMGCLASALRFRMNRLGLFPGGWLARGEPVELDDGAPRSVMGLLTVVFAIHRLLAGPEWMSPVRNYDSWSYVWPRGGGNLVSFVGDAPRLWPVPYFYGLLASDETRIAAQIILSTVAWLGLAWAVGRAVRHRTVSQLAALSILALGTTSQALSWDGLVMPESLTISLSVASLALFLRYRRKGGRLDALYWGISVGLLALVRPAVAPIAVLIGGAQAAQWLLRRVRVSAFAAAPMVLAIGWMLVLLPAQDLAYGRFEREIRGVSSANYGSDTFASVLFGRFVGGTETKRWLEAQGAPVKEAWVIAPRFEEDKVGWGRFRAAYGSSAAWQGWYSRQGGPLIYVKALVAEPIAHARKLVSDLPLMLESPWVQASYPEYGLEVPGIALAGAFFVSSGGVPLDLVLLILLTVIFTVVAARRGQRLAGTLLPTGVAVLVAAGGVILIAWTVVGIELVRHVVPGPLMLRVGAIFAAAGAADAAVDRSRARTADPV